MSKAFSIRVGDRLPYLAYDFGFSLALATALKFSARDENTKEVFINQQTAIIANGTYTIDKTVRVLTPDSGIGFYPLAAADVTLARKSVSCLFHIIWPGNLGETMPSEVMEKMIISENF